MISKLPVYYHTLKYLKPIQWYGQIRVRFKKTKIEQANLPALRARRGEWVPSIPCPSPHITQNQFCFLNKTFSIESPTIWQDERIDKLWLYHLHYFDLLKSAAADEIKNELILRWIKENPPSSKPAWEAYPLSLRIVNWIKWALLGQALTFEMLQSLIIQVRYLYKNLEIHLLANHLFANAKALLFAGLFFKGEEALRWQTKALTILRKELARQILADGGHFELSPMYHATILEDCLDLINLMQVYHEQVPLKWFPVSLKMLAWLGVMTHPDGEIAFFNDAALKMAANYQSLKAYGERLALPSITYPHQPMVRLPASGYCRLAFKEALLFADIAEVGALYQPGHAHADTLSFELSVHQARWLVNSGTSTYSDSKKRLRERGTASHNTLMLNDENSSHVWKSFRVAKRAHVFDIHSCENAEYASLRASHDGYADRFGVIHTRSFKMNKQSLSIEDILKGKGKHQVALFFHCHPEVDIQVLTEHRALLIHKRLAKQVIFESHYPFKIEASTYHPEFNCSLPNKKLVVTLESLLPLSLYTSFTWE